MWVVKSCSYPHHLQLLSYKVDITNAWTRCDVCKQITAVELTMDLSSIKVISFVVIDNMLPTVLFCFVYNSCFVYFCCIIRLSMLHSRAAPLLWPAISFSANWWDRRLMSKGRVPESWNKPNVTSSTRISREKAWWNGLFTLSSAFPSHLY